MDPMPCAMPPQKSHRFCGMRPLQRASAFGPGYCLVNPPPPTTNTTKTRSGPQRVRMSSGERPMGAAKGKQSDTEALCQPPPPPKGKCVWQLSH